MTTIPVRQPKPSENADADKDHESPEDDTDPDGIQDTDIDTRMPSSRPGRSVEPPPQRDLPPSLQPNVNVPPFQFQTQRASTPSGKGFASSGWHVLRRVSRTISRRYARCVPSGGHLQRFPGLTSRSNFVRQWIGTESWPIAAGRPHRVACFRLCE